MKKILVTILSLVLFANHAFADGGQVLDYSNAGVPIEAAKQVGETRSIGLSAAGASSQTNGKALQGSVNVFTTVTTGSADSCVLPLKAIVKRDDIAVFNNGAGILQVYPPSGGTLNALAVNAAIPIAAGDTGYFKRISLNGWISTKSGLSNAVVFVPTMAATPVQGTNQFSAGLNVIPTAAANTAAFLGASTPIPGQHFILVNRSGNTVRAKAPAGSTLNGATAGGYFAIATLLSAHCDTDQAADISCALDVNPTPAGP